ncbi:hypothetical protein [Streptomyces radicis]|uniref:Carbohydrate-binding protein n=1 Tax=Streptomyces radicis TaxID=1750517 RepID=A0A3A9W9E1_9ACTN|nr:hypothetical protein [Streptomyces radicis]RKN09705.1 hypothetical protein D7319_11670 [Streptomyces radicis]RKN23343.1 hypothetical protein D7318_12625 [Streptomyces radicis]
MSAGHTGGRGTPDEGGDDPFAYLYRPEGGEPQPQQPRQPSYHQVRPVGERTFGGQQGHRQQAGGSYATQASPSAYQQPQQHRPDAYYAAPETQVGGPPDGGRPDRRRVDPEPRRNGLLIGAIAVVLAVVLGVGAAILFSGGEDGDAAGDGSTSEPTGGSGDDEGGDEPSDEPSDEEAEPEGLPAAAVTELELAGGIGFQADVEGARSDDGAYVRVQNQQNSTITWTFDFQGEPGQYRLTTYYAAVADDQTMSFSINGTPREDPVNLRDWNGDISEWENSWFDTYNLVDLAEGENTVQLTCTAQCDVLIDGLAITEHQG